MTVTDTSGYTSPYTFSYTYDANNRLTLSVSCADSSPGGGASSTTTTANYFYDPNGNQLARVSETLASAGSGTAQVGIDPTGVELYEYDGRNRLVWTSQDGEEVNYTYRADGLRNNKETEEGKTTHLWDGANIVADMNGVAVVARYVRGIGLLLSEDVVGQQVF